MFILSNEKARLQFVNCNINYSSDDRLDNTTQRLLDNTARVRTVGRKDTTCAYWVIIIILLIAIIVVAVAWFRIIDIMIFNYNYK